MANKKPAPKRNIETLTLGWCDNGMVDGKFTEGVVYSMLTGLGSGIPIVNAMRVSGNQIARQRQNLIDMWYDSNTSDWLLWLDSDVVLTKDILTKLWNGRDAKERPLLTGVYMVTRMNEQSMMQPLPDLFIDTDDHFTIQFIHPLPKDQIIKVDSAGFGLLLMHRDVVTKLREKYSIFFYEDMESEQRFLGEDIHFFKKCKQLGIPLWADTSCIAMHMKRFPYDQEYYYFYWTLMHQQEQLLKGLAQDAKEASENT
jgi:hypothetical protein